MTMMILGVDEIELFEELDVKMEDGSEQNFSLTRLLLIHLY